MKFSAYFSRLNSITTQIFASFWVVFFLLLLIVFIVPKFDSRNYAELRGDDLRTYQKQIVTTFRENQLSRLLIYKNRPFPLEQTTEIRPILFNTKTQLILGVPEAESERVRQFTTTSQNVKTPLVKTFYDIEIAGPFSVHISAQDGNQEEPYLLYFVQRVDPQQKFVTEIFDRPLLLVFIIMALSSPLLWLLTLRISRPIRNLNEAAQAVSQGNFMVNPILEKKGVNELRQVGKSFNQMTNSLEDLLKTHRMLLSSISHELRTPLTRLQLAAALLRRRLGENNEITRIETETERMDLMINDLLKLSRNQMNIHASRQIFSIEELWNDVIIDTEFEAEQRNINFYFKQNIYAPEKYFLYGNHQSLTSALENILRNALKYTKSKIAAQTYLEDQKLMIVIDDNGAGIAEEEYDKIFQPFYRIDEARTRKTGGTGLGLAIVENSIFQHHGKVTASKSPLGGLRITLCLPLYTGGGSAH
ncbi:two-component system sensor histidine kinase CpxA [Pasteurella langaaensis DSM 22999]|uniref:histidine kinase n=1 Tax=Alitibacter langaaensis DSM 22999 TaxID=1122935 RepID=A0A2U0TD01_9PAST|nr:envelope stress sensor histidine kinase CpxA [Pasteurella langaaensis]PVX41472.1 two-component system sensor histidine kinase CpxA [Pasteurella langaaensis DSM 22999]